VALLIGSAVPWPDTGLAITERAIPLTLSRNRISSITAANVCRD